jgi:hypothetical protein
MPRGLPVIITSIVLIQPDRLSHTCEYGDQRPLVGTPSSASRSEADEYQVLGSLDRQHIGWISPKRSLEAVVTEYDQLIEPWFPLLSTSAKARLQTPEARPLDAGLLGQALELIVTGPDPTSKAQGQASVPPLYQALKRTIATFEAFEICTILVAQARVLTALFEAVHGLFQAAYISIASTARSIEALDLFSRPETDLDITSVTPTDEELILVRCAFAILGR